MNGRPSTGERHGADARSRGSGRGCRHPGPRRRYLMASVEDRWFSARPGPDGKKAKKARHGSGRRWKVHYTDPDGRQRSESFDRRVDAERFKATAEADILRGVFIDPDAGKITLRKYALDIWFPAQTFGASTRERVESRQAACPPRHRRGQGPRLGPPDRTVPPPPPDPGVAAPPPGHAGPAPRR